MMIMMTRVYCIVIFALLALTERTYSDPVQAYPVFPTRAEFTIENILFDGLHKPSLHEFVYDYDNNHLIVITQQTIEYYNYTSLKRALFFLLTDQQQCGVYPIDIDNPADGLSATTDAGSGKTHIRPLQDFLLLTSNATYVGEAILRGFIQVEQWKSLPADGDTEITWSFAKSAYAMPWDSFHYSIPVQCFKRRLSDGSLLQVMNIFGFRADIIRTQFPPPKGIYCEDWVPRSELTSLQDNGIRVPDKFSVRIDVSTSIQQLWRSVHLRYHNSRERKLIRYDYTPSGNTRNPISVIIDYTDEAPRTYTIDRRTGSCQIDQSIEMSSVPSILHDPIELLIKFENFLLSNTQQRIFQFVGTRSCRDSIRCSSFIAQSLLFPPDPNEEWLATNIEWAWSKRQNGDNIQGDFDAEFDYPVQLYLKLYRVTGGTPADVSYEFYDYRTDVHLNEFDVNLCYRSKQLWYRHFAFELKVRNRTTADDIENGSINRRRLVEYVRGQLMAIMSIKYLRISQLELDHHPNQEGHNDTFYCIFTLLDRTPYINETLEVGLFDAQTKLERGINTGQFRFDTDEGLSIEAVPWSLENVQHFYSFNPNVSVNQIEFTGNKTVKIVDEVHEKIKYSDGSQAVAVVGGMIIGLIFGAIFVFSVFLMIKKRSQMSASGGLTFGNISFKVRKNKPEDQQATITMEHPMALTNETDS